MNYKTSYHTNPWYSKTSAFNPLGFGGSFANIKEVDWRICIMSEYCRSSPPIHAYTCTCRYTTNLYHWFHSLPNYWINSTNFPSNKSLWVHQRTEIQEIAKDCVYIAKHFFGSIKRKILVNLVRMSNLAFFLCASTHKALVKTATLSNI